MAENVRLIPSEHLLALLTHGLGSPALEAEARRRGLLVVLTDQAPPNPGTVRVLDGGRVQLPEDCG